jgi:hypothetical protein
VVVDYSCCSVNMRVRACVSAGADVGVRGCGCGQPLVQVRAWATVVAGAAAGKRKCERGLG